MALILGRRVGEVVFVQTDDGKEIEVTLLSHHHTGNDKVALIKATGDGEDKEFRLSYNDENHAVLLEVPKVSITLAEAGKRGVRLGFHGDKSVTFLRKEVKERANG